MDDRTGVMMSAALMLIAATQGTDEDVKQAARGHDGLVYLAGKYGQQAAETVEVIKRIFPIANTAGLLSADRPRDDDKQQPIVGDGS